MLLSEATQQFLRQCELRGLRPATIESYSWQLRPFVAFLGVAYQVDEVKRVNVETYLLSLRRRGLAERSVCDALTVLRLFWNWAVDEHLCPVAPVTGIRLRRHNSRAPRRTDWREYDALVNALPVTTWVDRRDVLLIHCLFLAGLRVGETVRLTTESFDLRAGLLHVVDGKTGPGVLPLLPDLAAAYTVYMAERPAYPGKSIILSADGGLGLRREQPIRPNGVRQMLRRRCSEAGLRYLNPHSFRHGLAMYLLNEKRVEMSIVQRILRHARISTTEQFYAQWTVESIRSVYTAALT